MRAEIFNFNEWISDVNSKTLKSRFDRIIKQSGFTVLNFCEHFFQPHGYTALWLLGESHVALHTFPEEDKTYIELSSCNKEFFDNFIKLINK